MDSPTIINGMLITDNPDLNFADISDEGFRVYVYPDGSEVVIRNPIALAIKPPANKQFGGGSHRVVDADGFAHYIPVGWIHLYWENKPGKVRINF